MWVLLCRLLLLLLCTAVRLIKPWGLPVLLSCLLLALLLLQLLLQLLLFDKRAILLLLAWCLLLPHSCDNSRCVTPLNQAAISRPWGGRCTLQLHPLLLLLLHGRLWPPGAAMCIAGRAAARLGACCHRC